MKYFLAPIIGGIAAVCGAFVLLVLALLCGKVADWITTEPTITVFFSICLGAGMIGGIWFASTDSARRNAP